MTSSGATTVTELVPILRLAHRYLLYDVNAVTYLRREHNISGVLIGSLPQASQQNVFLGLPLELMPEEARLLVENGIAHVVDDVPNHKSKFLGTGMSPAERTSYQATLRKQGEGAATEASKRSDEKKKVALKKAGTENWNDIPDDMFQVGQRKGRKAARKRSEPKAANGDSSEDELLFALPATCSTTESIGSRAPSSSGAATLQPFAVTPAISSPALQGFPSAEGDNSALPFVPPSYPLYKHLHRNGYFLAPGLRFGCQYTAYPGDPLRFHSHFLCNGMDWNQDFDLLDLVGGGRLGTGVKKGFLIGGEENKSDVRVFCIEWSGM